MIPVALAGGLLAQPAYRALVRPALDRFPGLVTREEPVDPVAGALVLAQRAALP
jgi:hypothetical protein